MVSPVEAEMINEADNCIQCGVCYYACPAVEVNPEFSGPAALTKSVIVILTTLLFTGTPFKSLTVPLNSNPSTKPQKPITNNTTPIRSNNPLLNTIFYYLIKIKTAL